MHEFDFDPSSLRDWLAAVGLLRIISDTTDVGTLQWRQEHGRYRLFAVGLPDDMAARCATWTVARRDAWAFGGRDNVNFDAAFWREHANGSAGIATALWCAAASDAVLHRSGEKLRASVLEYAHGGGHQDWLGSLREFLATGATVEGFARVLAGGRNERSNGTICRWDPACERSHAYRGKAPTKDPMTQDQTINALAAIGFASCASAPTMNGLATPLQVKGNNLRWPVWTDSVRTADLEAALCCSYHWPVMEARRWLSGKLYCFSRGELREPAVSAN